MPSLGGNDTLRGFRDVPLPRPARVAAAGRVPLGNLVGLDVALFYDAGKVALDRGISNLDGLQSDYGFGFRFNTDNGVIFRIDAGFGSRDGTHLYLVWGGVF